LSLLARSARYRYYISQGLIQGRRGIAPLGRRVPAAELENLVEERLRAFLQNGFEVLAVLEANHPGGEPDTGNSNEATDLIAHGAELARRWPELPPAGKRRILLALIQRVDLMPASVEVRFLPTALASVLRSTINGSPALGSKPLFAERRAEPDERTLTWSIPARLQRTGIEKRLLVEDAKDDPRRKPDHSLARLLAQAQQYHALLMRGGAHTMEALAKEANVTGSYFTRILRLSFLAPEATKAILRNRHPIELTAKRLANEIRLPIEWEKQRALLGLG
jgi:hypothetical protein